MRVLVANLAGVKIRPDGKLQHFAKAGSRWPQTVGWARSVDYYPFPFWLAYTSALLKRHSQAEVRGLDGVVLDLDAEGYLAIVREWRPDLVIVEATTLTLGDDLALLAGLRRELGSRLAVCGAYATARAAELLAENAFIDYVLRHEYEVTALELVGALMEGRPLEGVLGLTYRDAGTVKANPDRPLLADLDFLPFPDRDDFPATIYPDFTLYSPCINIVATRGCPAACVFCLERHVIYASPLYRTRHPDRVVDEMVHCIDRYGARQFYFDDMSLVVNKKFTQQLCDRIIERGLKVPWTCMGDAMFVDYDTLAKMRQAGCIGMKFGVESAHQEILKGIGKPLKLERAKEVVKWSRELGIRTHATFCLGLPGDTRETIEGTWRFVEELGADTAQVSRAVPYPGTPFYAWAKQNGYLITEDLSQYDGTSAAVISYPGLAHQEIDELYEKFARKLARQKIWRYVCEPKQSLSILREMSRRKGVLSTLNSVRTFVGRAL